MTEKRQPQQIDDLGGTNQDRARARMAHLLEVETGFRSGSPFWPEPGEPRPQYDPERTTLTQRRRAKVAELCALHPQDAKVLGLGQISFRTLERMAAELDENGLMGLADGRWTPPLRGHRSIGPATEKAIHAVHAETLHRSKVSMRTKERMIHQYVREKFGAEAEEEIPHYVTLWRVWKEWFGPQGARQRYARSAAAVDAGTSRVVISRPGQVVVLDTTPLPVKVLDDVFEEPISVDLTLALDAFTHSLVAFRLTPGSDSSVEVAMLLRDVMLPLPMRPGWGPEMEWPYPGVPAAVVAEFAGHPVAGRPYFAPETVTSDHGSVYKNHHMVSVARKLGVVLLPARTMRPTDKAACERAFGGIRSLLLELLLGYSGVDVADRGVDPEGDATWTLEEMEHLLATWIVQVWQNRELTEYGPAWDPGGRHSPNTLFAMAGARDGIDLEVPEPGLYYELLFPHYVKIHGNRGVKVGGLWYDGPALGPYRSRPSARSGVHRGKWAVHRDPRDCREVFFQDPSTNDWHPLQWRGLPRDEDIPAFSDARVREVLREAARIGLKPQDDSELLPVLLDLVADRTPVSAWPSQMTKSQRLERARELARARSAAVDRPTRHPDGPRGLPPAPTSAELAQRNARAITADRRRRREATVTSRPTPPPRMGEVLRTEGMFVLPDESHAEPEEHA
ncbi:transposase [Streptomyces sp. NPDC041068]|uniref:transposase n=1 Tax=Streptomyces sp. NPDC041068 TaxID=3155130 RepID=UPI0033D2052D